MRILHVTSQAPDVNSGGAIGIFQSMYSLVNVGAQVDYVGPKIINSKIREEYACKYNKLYELPQTNNIFKILLTILRGQINRSFYAWKELKLDYTQYDVVYLDFARQEYVFKDVMKTNKSCKKIVRLHNVEYDYTRTDFRTKKSLENGIVYMLAKKQEKNVLKNADVVLALTDNDSKRIQELYGTKDTKINIVPVCVKGASNIETHQFNDKIKLLITGSLWFGPNIEGIMWFIENVVSNLNISYSLTIAGYRPNDTIKNMCDKYNITLVDSPKDITPLFNECDVVIAPIFDGAGMKVKIAEALSYGKTVMSTSHGLTGYVYTQGEGVFRCDSAKDYIDSISEYYELTIEQKENMSKKAHKLYLDNYSLDSSIRYIKDILKYIKDILKKH